MKGEAENKTIFSLRAKNAQVQKEKKKQITQLKLTKPQNLWAVKLQSEKVAKPQAKPQGNFARYKMLQIN